MTFFVEPDSDDFKLSSYDYFLPRKLIAQEPTIPRDESRLLVIFRDGIFHTQFKNVIRFMKKDDLLVFNATRVVKTKLSGKKETGGNAKITVIEKVVGDKENVWKCFVKANNPKPGVKLIFNDIQAEIVGSKGKYFFLQFDCDLIEYLDKFGSYTLPGYIKRELDDPEMYQTVYSEKPGSLAAPTAGLHFTKELIKEIEMEGVSFAKVFLDVGLGTFEPITTENVLEHKMHYENFEIDAEDLSVINNAIKNKRRIFAVGTTTVRSLESAFADRNAVEQSLSNNSGIEKRTNLFIYPGYHFKVPYFALITNFHIPKSSLVVLVSAFIGRKRALKIYDKAIELGYKFYSLGDATMIIDENSSQFLSGEDFENFEKI